MMANAGKKNATFKLRAFTYDAKLKVNCSFDDLIAVSVGKQQKDKTEKKK
jgi:hypothetical protein